MPTNATICARFLEAIPGFGFYHLFWLRIYCWGPRPPVVPELIADGVAIILSALAYRSRKRTVLRLREPSPRRRRLEYIALGLSMAEFVFRPGSERYDYDLTANLIGVAGALTAYFWLARREGKSSQSNSTFEST